MYYWRAHYNCHYNYHYNYYYNCYYYHYARHYYPYAGVGHYFVDLDYLWGRGIERFYDLGTYNSNRLWYYFWGLGPYFDRDSGDQGADRCPEKGTVVGD